MLYVRFLSSLSPPLDTFATVSKVYRPSQTPHPAMSSRDSRGLYGVTPFSPAPAPLREGKQEGRSGSYRRPHPWLRELSWVTLDPQALKPHLMRAGRAPGRGGLQSLEAWWDYPRLAQQAARSAKKSLAPPGPRAPPPFPAHSPPEREEHTRRGEVWGAGRALFPTSDQTGMRPDGLPCFSSCLAEVRVSSSALTSPTPQSPISVGDASAASPGLDHHLSSPFGPPASRPRKRLRQPVVSLEKDTRERDWGRHRGRAEGEDGERPMAHVFPGSTAPGGPRTPPAEYPGEGRTGEGRLPARAD